MANIHTKRDFIVSGEKVEISDKFKYLFVNCNLLDKSEVTCQAPFVAMHKCPGMGKISLTWGLPLFDSLVKLIIEYGREIWSNGIE